ncbi:outer membrane protein assembly factor [Rubritalea spongiae]|uniref:Outer membrane protein assembly factor n=1 Tax=Rubritalea spongiae TaxID=430797 RepID=A0ABW5E7S1_9BACT
MRSFLTTLLLSSSIANAANVQLSGIDENSRGKYSIALEPRLVFINARPATSWRADDASFFLKRLLIRDGYPDAQVNWTIQGQTINLKAIPGKRLFYGTVHSNQESILDQQTLTNYFYQPIVDGELANIDKPPYIAEYTKKGVENVENYLKSKGYWNAQVSLISEKRQNDTGRVNVNINILQGSLHHIARPTFQGIDSATEQAILKEIAQYLGQVATTENITAINSAVIEYFRKTGFHFATVDVQPIHSASKTTLAFIINQGRRYIVDDINVTGNVDTQTRRIKRHFNDLQGKPYDASEATKDTGRLLKTGIFKKVVVTPITHEDGTLDLDIEVEEGDSVTTRTYLGADSYDGFIAGLSYTDLNFQGKMWQLNARGEYSGRGLLGEVGITEPFFMGEHISFNFRGFALQRRPEGYDKYEMGLEGSWLWNPNDIYSLRAYLGTSIVDTSSVVMTDQELGPKEYLNTRIGAINSFEFRDNPILPTEGYHGQILTEFGNIIGDATSNYFKLELNNSYRHHFGEKQYLTTRLDTGLILPQDSDDLPIDRRFFTGGANTMRGYEEDELGPRSQSGDPLGGEAYWVGSVEFIREITGPFHLGIFYDLGQVYEDYSDLNFSNPSQAVGLSARIHLPIGPIRFEYGYNLDRKDYEPSGAFHFSIGASF